MICPAEKGAGAAAAAEEEEELAAKGDGAPLALPMDDGYYGGNAFDFGNNFFAADGELPPEGMTGRQGGGDWPEQQGEEGGGGGGFARSGAAAAGGLGFDEGEDVETERCVPPPCWLDDPTHLLLTSQCV